MKKFIKLLLFVLLSISIFSFAAQAAENRYWLYPNKIKTYIPPNHKRSVMMKHAFDEWTRKTNRRVMFNYVTSPNVAQLKVSFVDKIPNADREIGLTNTYFKPSTNKITKAEILIAEKTASGRQLNNDAVYTLMLHEIGHALGIATHSNDPASVMYKYEDDKQEILQSDLKNLSNIYGWK